MENPIGLLKENDDLIAICFLEALPPAGGAFASQQRATDPHFTAACLAGSGGLLGLPQAKSGTQCHDQEREMDMHDHGRLGPLGKVPQMPGMLAFFENAVLNDRA